jgi:predicted DNA-binding transcriptional regulator AlpA
MPIRLDDDPPSAPAGPAPLLLSARQAAVLCSVSLATFWRWRSSGRVPPPVRVGGCVRWRRQAIVDWIDSGCPSSSGAA